MKKVLLWALIILFPSLLFAGEGNDLAIRGFTQAIKKYPDYNVYYLSILGVDCSEAIVALVAQTTKKKVNIYTKKDGISLADVEKDNPLFLDITGIDYGIQYHTVKISVDKPFKSNDMIGVKIEVNKDGDIIGAEIIDVEW